MKKYLLFICITALATAHAFAQGKNQSQNHQASANTFGQDVTIAPFGIHQTAVKITTAFNGWQYAAYSTIDTGNFTGGITVMGSRDNGASWTEIDNFGGAFKNYPALEVVVAGTDTNALSLYVIEVEKNDLDNSYSLILDVYDATTGTWIAGNTVVKNDSGAIRDVAIASDYAFPAFGASPYSVGFLYSSSYLSLGSNPSADSVIFIASLDAGTTWGVRQSVAIDSSGLNYYRKVAVSYGYSPGAGNGRYFGAWESINNLVNSTGSIYTSRSDTMVSDAWITPVNLDSITASTAGLCKNPSIAVSVGNTDNDSGGVTAVVLVDRDSLGDGSSIDVLGFYNKIADSTNTWNRLDVINTAENDMQPDISYCTGINSFVVTYFDSTDQLLPYVRNNVNLVAPSTWITVTAQYNDIAAGLITAGPQISIDQSMNTAAFAWIQSDGFYLQAMFDAENSTVSIPGKEKSNVGLTLFPNPAIHDINVNVSLKSSSHIRVDIYNDLGQKMLTEDLGTLQAGNSNHLVNIDHLANGNYLVKVTGDRFINTKALVIAR